MLVVLTGLLLILWVVYKTKDYIRSKNWPHTNGNITKLDLQTKIDAIHFYRRHSTYPVVEYEYSVNGKAFVGGNVTFDTRNIFKEKFTEHKYEKYMPWDSWTIGKEVVVFYNSKNPSESVLIKDLLPYRRSHYLALVITGLILLSIGFVIENINV